MQNQTGQAVWITVHSDDVIEEAGLLSNGEAIEMRTPFGDLSLIEYRYRGADCSLSRDAIQSVSEPSPDEMRTVVLTPCEPKSQSHD